MKRARSYSFNWRRQDYISLANPSPSCLHKSRVRARAYTVGQRWKGTARKRKFTVYPPTSYFGIERAQKVIPNPQKPSNPHYPIIVIQYLIPLNPLIEKPNLFFHILRIYLSSVSIPTSSLIFFRNITCNEWILYIFQ